jgi:protein gp37
MGAKSQIEWTDATWNPTIGCTRISAGCKNCYFFAQHDMRHAAWLAGNWPDAPKQYHHPATTIQTFTERLDMPLRWRKPRRIFVNSLSDLFHEAIPDEFVAAVLGIAACAPRHTFQILTKRAGRMNHLINTLDVKTCVAAAFRLLRAPEAFTRLGILAQAAVEWPLRNVWLGVSCEDQKTADERIPMLETSPAAIRFLSCEPLLGPIVFEKVWLYELDWIIAGGESGKVSKNERPQIRPMHPDWVRGIRDQCESRTDMGRPWPLPFFFKQWGSWAPHPHSPRRGVYTGAGIFWRPTGRFGNQGDWWEGRAQAMDFVGKKAAGAVLDGREWREMPV